MHSIPAGMAPARPERLQQPQNQQQCQQNVAEWERLASLAGGAVLLIAGSSSRGLRGFAALAAGAGLIHRGWTGYCPAYDALGVCHVDSAHGHALAPHQGVRIEESVLIDRPAAELYDLWSRLEQLPQFMTHLESVTQQTDGHSHWVARGPLGWQLQWDAETIQERPGELIAWQSLPGSQVDTAGSIHFRPVANRGTELKVTLRYDPPGGKLVASLAEFFHLGVEDSVRADLRRFKQWCETGEIATTKGQPSGRRPAAVSRQESQVETVQ